MVYLTSHQYLNDAYDTTLEFLYYSFMPCRAFRFWFLQPCFITIISSGTTFTLATVLFSCLVIESSSRTRGWIFSSWIYEMETNQNKVQNLPCQLWYLRAIRYYLFILNIYNTGTHNSKPSQYDWSYSEPTYIYLTIIYLIKMITKCKRRICCMKVILIWMQFEDIRNASLPELQNLPFGHCSPVIPSSGFGTSAPPLHQYPLKQSFCEPIKNKIRLAW